MSSLFLHFTGMNRLIVILLLAINAGFLIYVSGTNSVNRTEAAHLGATVYTWQTGCYDVFHVNPPLTRYFSGMAMAAVGAEVDLSSYSPRSQDRSEWKLGESFIAVNAPDTVRQIVFLCRMALLPVILLGGWFGFRLASEMFGRTSGLVFLILWTFSPLFLGWGATLCPDMPATALGMIAAYYYRQWIHVNTWKTALIAGLAIGLLPLAKTTWIVAFGIFPLIWLLSKNRPAWKQAVAVLLVALYMLNMGYVFDGSFRLLNDYTFISDSLRGETGNRFENSVLGYVPVPFPAEFIQGIDTQRRDFEKGLESYLFGKYQNHGWWYWYFVVLALKEPLGTLLLFAAAVLAMLRFGEYRVAWNDEILIAVPFLVLMALLCSQTGFSIHPRYLLPAMPFFYLSASRIGRVFEQPGRIRQGAVVMCLVWMTASSLWVFPYSMSYFNELIPVRKRPEILLGSCIDWGQDAYRLKHWLQKHPEAAPIRVEYPCPETVERLGIRTVGKPPHEPEPGWYALGVNDLYAAAGRYAWFKNIEPVAMIGYSIYVFHVDENEAARLKGGRHVQ